MSATSTATDLSVISRTWYGDEALDALAETVDELIQGARNTGVIVSSFSTTVTAGFQLDFRTPSERRDQLKRRLVMETQLRCKLSSGALITPRDVIDCENQTIKHRALVACGYERFIEEAGAVVIDELDENKLLLIEQHNGQHPIVFADVKDATSDKRYLLRVPPDMMRVRQAIAWTFGLEECDYKPEVET